MEKIGEDLYRIRVPLPGNPLKSVNCYVIADKPPVFVDVGMNMEACLNALRTAVERFGKPIVVATHMHADHLGVAGRIADVVLMSGEEIEVFRKFASGESWKRIVEFFIASGFPEDVARLALSLHPGVRFFAPPKEIREIELISAAGYEFEPIPTPGHTPGHVCLYERTERILLSGDHVLFDITPNIGYWENFNSLEAYIESLKMIRKLPVRVVYPGHREASSKLDERVEELLEHHERRLEEVIAAVDGKVNAWQVAQRISWDVDYGSWDDLPVTQKWFAMSETIAHLEYLADRGELRRVVDGGRVYYVK
ncbi:MAG: MBL fold metallo-hydrolase [Archaeoglobaceae archaeon]